MTRGQAVVPEGEAEGRQGGAGGTSGPVPAWRRGWVDGEGAGWLPVYGGRRSMVPRWLKPGTFRAFGAQPWLPSNRTKRLRSPHQRFTTPPEGHSPPARPLPHWKGRRQPC